MDPNSKDSNDGWEHVSPLKGDDDSDGSKSLDGDVIMEMLDTFVSAVSEITDRIKGRNSINKHFQNRFYVGLI